MKQTLKLLILSTVLFLTACDANQFINSMNDSFNNEQYSSSESTNSEISNSISTESQSNKVTVPAHTLKDSNPPINADSIGQVVDEDTWESFRNAPASKFNGNYNYTYRTYSGGYQTIQSFTKNGYYVESISGKLYYERKSGSSFYSYIYTNEGYLREVTTLDIQNKYTSIIHNEIYVHMFDYSNYEYDDYDGCYRYYATGFTAAVKFQGGYLTYLYYIIGTNFFEIKSSFETTIDIPQSYYYS